MRFFADTGGCLGIDFTPTLRLLWDLNVRVCCVEFVDQLLETLDAIGGRSICQKVIVTFSRALAAIEGKTISTTINSMTSFDNVLFMLDLLLIKIIFLSNGHWIGHNARAISVIYY